MIIIARARGDTFLTESQLHFSVSANLKGVGWIRPGGCHLLTKLAKCQHEAVGMEGQIPIPLSTSIVSCDILASSILTSPSIPVQPSRHPTDAGGTSGTPSQLPAGVRAVRPPGRQRAGPARRADMCRPLSRDPFPLLFHAFVSAAALECGRERG